jgi:hypothetical protein
MAAPHSAATNVDVITDFSVANDTILLDLQRVRQWWPCG